MNRPPAETESLSQVIEKTLDPGSEAEWEELRALGHRMLDDMFLHMKGLRETPAWVETPVAARSALQGERVPRGPQDLESVYKSFQENVLPYGVGNAHPRFYGWVQGNGTAVGMLADMLAAGMNPHMAGFNQAPAVVEDQVNQWLAELMGMPAGTSGLLTSGGSVANLIGLAVGRQVKAGYDVRKEGVRGGPQLRIYCSVETHSWVKKAVELMGMGRNCLVSVPVNHGFRTEIDGLRTAIRTDKAAGHRPICVVGTAGTVNTGATDDLEAMAEICREEGLWFHVDGAFGALAYWVEGLRPALKGMERADSLAFDLHKWGYMPFEVGCVLVRDGEAHRGAFATEANYLTAMERGPAAGRLRFADRGIELTRGFKALKVWMSLKTYGTDAIAALVEQNVAQARYLAARVEREPMLELAADVPLNIVCFRYRGASDEQNKEILLRLQERGIAVPSSTVVHGRFALRAAIVNHRARREDFDAMVDGVLSIGRDVVR